MDIDKYDDLGQEIISRIDCKRHERLESVLLAGKPVVMAILANRCPAPGFPNSVDEVYQIILNPELERISQKYILVNGGYVGMIKKTTFPKPPEHSERAKQAGHSRQLSAMHQSLSGFGSRNYMVTLSPDLEGSFSGIFSHDIEVYAAVIPVT